MHAVFFLTVTFVSSKSGAILLASWASVSRNHPCPFFGFCPHFISLCDAVEEGRVAGFLLATIVILQLRCAVMKKMRLIEVCALFMSHQYMIYALTVMIADKTWIMFHKIDLLCFNKLLFYSQVYSSCFALCRMRESYNDCLVFVN